MTTLIFVRHGQSLSNLEGIYAGFVDKELSPLGNRQAAKTAEYVTANYKIDKVYASDLKRAYSTAKAVADILGIEVIKDEALREINAGDWEGTPFDELINRDGYSVWLNDIGNSACPGGESVKELQERVVGAIERIISENDGKTILIGTHATPIRVMQTALTGLSLDDMKNVDWVSNASVTVVEADNGKYDFKVLSYDEHLGDMRSYLPSNC